MAEFRRILCPVDFSDFSRHALEHALRIASWFGATVTVFHVYPAGPPTVIFSGLPVIPGDALPPLPGLSLGTREDTIAALTRFAESVAVAGVQVRVDARAGSAVRGILDEAQSLQADLIVLGTHGRSGPDRWVLGSVAEKVLRKSSCPVLTVPPPVSQPAQEALAIFKRILCPVDFSDASLKAIERSLSLAKEADADLLLLHVIEEMPDMTHWSQPNAIIVEYLRDRQQQALAQMRSAVPQAAHAWCHPEALLATGRPYQEILRIARERDTHLIVMGVHGRNPVDLMFFGSTTSHVVRAATCPVLTVRG